MICKRAKEHHYSQVNHLEEEIEAQVKKIERRIEKEVCYAFRKYILNFILNIFNFETFSKICFHIVSKKNV